MRDLMMVADLGASKILAAIATPDGQILAREKHPTIPQRHPQEIIDQICAVLLRLGEQTFQPGDCWQGAALATPGPLSYPDGVVFDSPNLGWREVHLLTEMRSRLAQELVVEKDTNMAVQGEYRFGQRGLYRNILYITMSTGIGGGLLLDGKLYRGCRGGAGEIGHMVIDPDGPLCGCGRRGCLEAMASGNAIAAQASEMTARGWGKERGLTADNLGAREIGEAARSGDAQAQMLVQKITGYLATGIANLVNIFNPEMIVVGGSVALGWQDLMARDLEAAVKAQVFPLNSRDLHLEFTKLGEDIVLLGCVAALIEAGSPAGIP
ncbi:MAG TPA: ROK family protein [Syntrophomonadaceae bacterium]|nr:ROK family protein [Syntrophomonadaceae bacterium]